MSVIKSVELAKWSKAATLAVAVAVVAGCSSKGTVTDGAATDASNQGNTVNVEGVNTGSTISGTQGATDVNNLRTVFYFDYDQSSIRNDGLADLQGHAQYLAANPGASVRLEGHADERGTREYNIALGERRAKAVERFLNGRGASGAQLETISYGEEKPDPTGSLDLSRRVEIVYTSR